MGNEFWTDVFSKGHSFHVKKTGNYIKIGNKHIFMGIECLWLENDAPIGPIIDRLVKTQGQKLHFIIGNENAIKRMGAILLDLKGTKIAPNVRIVVHVPHELSELKDEIEKISGDLDGKTMRFICERKMPEFHNENYRLIIEYIRNSCMYAHIGCILHTNLMPVNDNPIQNTIQRENLDKYKVDIIRRFKAKTPLGILKSFNNEEEIWDFIKMQNDWAVDEKNTVKKKVNITTDAKTPEEVKSYVEDLVKGAAADIIKK